MHATDLAKAAAAKSQGATKSLTIEDVKAEHGLRTAFATPDANAMVVANFLDLRHPARFGVYEIDMIRQFDSQNRAIRVHKFADKMKIMELLRATCPSLSNSNKWVTDGDLIWSTARLFDSSNESTGQVYLTRNNLSYENECGETLSVAQVTIALSQIITPNTQFGLLFSDAAAAASKRSNANILLRGLNAFFTAHARSQTQQYLFTTGSKGYNHTRQLHVDNVLHALPGFTLSTRPGIQRLLLNVNTNCSVFFKQQNLNQFLRSQTYHRKTSRQKTAMLKGTKVSLTFDIQSGWPSQDARVRFIQEVGATVTSQNCHGNVKVDTCFTSGTTICPHRVYRPWRAVPFNGNSHAIKVAKSMRNNLQPHEYEWYPAEALNILPDEPFHSQLEARQASTMITNARIDPATKYDSIIGAGRTMFGFDRQGQPGCRLAAFDNSFRVGNDMLVMPAKWLDPPVIRYDGRNARVTNASWNLTDVRFYESDSKIGELKWINASHTGSNDGIFAELARGMMGALRTHNILQSGPEPSFSVTPVNGWSIRQANFRPVFEQTISALLQPNRGTQAEAPILVAIDHKEYDLYSYIKRVAELQLGIHTIFVTLNKANFDYQRCSNIALKYNLKLSQATHALGVTNFRALLSDNSNCDTIVIGADVTHPGKASSEGTPSIAAVVGNTDDNFMHFPGSMRLQRSRKEFIIELGDMVKERLLDWAEKHNGRLPRRVLFYRDGVADTQYAKLRSYEIPQIQQAFNWAQEYLDFRADPANDVNKTLDASRNPWPQVDNSGKRRDSQDDLFKGPAEPNVDFELTYVVVGKRHNTRFFPHDGKKKLPRGNVTPGLVVDQVITHPVSLDFYLQSHNPIMGTGRSAHYFVLQNNMRLSTAQIQEVVSLIIIFISIVMHADPGIQTHELCYAYSRATRGVSYCAPAYYADRLCDRGRAYLRHWLTNEDHPDYQPHRDQVQGESTTAYHDAIKNHLRDQPYWRQYALANPNELKYGFRRRNPWHPNMDNTMFYL